MQVVEYSPQHADALAFALGNAEFEAPLLRFEPYLRHYFLGHPRCRLLLLLDKGGGILATLGSESVPLCVQGNKIDASVLSNTYSFRSGGFPFLFLHWMKSSRLGIIFPGNALIDSLIAKQKRWTSIPGLYTYWLNWGYPDREEDPAWKVILKPIARQISRINPETFPKAVEQLGKASLTVTEESSFVDVSAKRVDSFGFRIDADPSYLNWRFNTTLDYVKYRVFRIRDGQITAGYAVLADWPHCLIVSYCDGDDPVDLACGVLLAIAALNKGPQRYRKVLLTSMHSKMAAIFHRFGFRPKKSDSAFYIAALDNSLPRINVGADWLVNMDLGDAGTVASLVYPT